jgi:hypothetical protein
MELSASCVGISEGVELGAIVGHGRKGAEQTLDSLRGHEESSCGCVCMRVCMCVYVCV